MFADKELVEHIHQSADGFFGIDHHAAFKIPPGRRFRPHPGTGEIRGTEKGPLPVDNDGFHVISRTKDPLESIGIDQLRKAIKVFAKTWSRFLGVDQTDLDAFGDQVIKHREKGIELSRGALVMKILDIRRRDPDKPFRGGNQILEDGLVDFFIENEAHLWGSLNSLPPTWSVQD